MDTNVTIPTPNLTDIKMNRCYLSRILSANTINTNIFTRYPRFNCKKSLYHLCFLL